MAQGHTRSSRRTFLRTTGRIALVAAGALATASCGDGRPNAPDEGEQWRIGLSHVGIDHEPASLEPLRQELEALGYRHGGRVLLDWRNLPDEAAANVVARQFAAEPVDAIVAFENQATRAAHTATNTIPVVFLHVDDPVTNGWVQSLARPGGNMTGFVGAPDLPEKRIELFKALVPDLRRLLVLSDPADPVTRRALPAVRQAAGALQIEPVELSVGTQAEVEAALAAVTPREVQSVFLASRNLQSNFTGLVIRLSHERGIPFASHRKEFVVQGALFSYGPDQATTGRAAAHVVDKILRRTAPADIPVEQADVLELVVNATVARSLALALPREVLAQATEVLQ